MMDSGDVMYCVCALPVCCCVGVPWISASVFAYGMTGSGKTYTMRGIMDMALADIFQHMKQVKKSP